MFSLTEQQIYHEKQMPEFSDVQAGGLVFFEGRVRNHNEGKQVKSLEYQVYEQMAVKVGQEIMKQTMDNFNLHHAKCIHRFGHLNLGDVAIWVGASSSHREEAFRACQFIVDQVKNLVPIWKKEHYISGPSEWIACHRCASGHEHQLGEGYDLS